MPELYIYNIGSNPAVVNNYSTRRLTWKVWVAIGIRNWSLGQTPTLENAHPESLNSFFQITDIAHFYGEPVLECLVRMSQLVKLCPVTVTTHEVTSQFPNCVSPAIVVVLLFPLRENVGLIGG